MIGRRLVNGVESSAIAADDRGLQYGDGLFETMSAANGRIRHFGLHMARLAEGCSRLGLPMPAAAVLEDECRRALEGLGSATVKLIVTRGSGPRGYAPPVEPTVTRIVMATSSHAHDADAGRPLVLQVCETRLSLNPLLAGLKHLNRLEQVLAAAELRGQSCDEGLTLSMDGRLICATAANVFIVHGERLLTPAIRDCGVAGIMRQVVLRAANDLHLSFAIRDLSLDDLASAQEAFLTNAVRGIRPVGTVLNVAQFRQGGFTERLRERVEQLAA